MPVIICKILIGLWLLLSGLTISTSVNSWMDDNHIKQEKIQCEINSILNNLKGEIQKYIKNEVKQNINDYQRGITKDKLNTMINNVLNTYFSNNHNLNISNITLNYVKHESNYTLVHEDKLIIKLYFNNIIKEHLHLPPTIKEINSYSNGWKKGIIGEYEYEIKIYKNPSEYGINNGKISKLIIRKRGKKVTNYDRGWDIKPKNQKQKEIIDIILNHYK